LCFIELGQTSAEFLYLASYLCPLAVQHFAIAFDKLDVIGRCYVVQSFEFLKHSVSQFNDFGVGVTEVLSDVFSCLLIKVKLFDRIVRDLNQSFSRPWHEPHNCCVVDESWIHSSIVSQVIACFRHQKDDVEIVLDS